MKLVLCAKTNKVLGLHMCGEDAPEIVQVLPPALKATLCLFNSFTLKVTKSKNSHLVLLTSTTLYSGFWLGWGGGVGTFLF